MLWRKEAQPPARRARGASNWSLPHPYGVVTDATGAFKLTDVPAGTYKLKIWHEAFGEKIIDVSVKAKETTKVEVAL
mgnify:CR=1 FL=1